MVVTTYTKQLGPRSLVEQYREEVVPRQGNRTGAGREDLRLSVPQFGLVYLHVLAWWLFQGKPCGVFASWQDFRTSGRKVDHGDQGHPHELDLEKLQLQSARESAGQGAALRWWQYHPQGGLREVVLRRPAASP